MSAICIILPMLISAVMTALMVPMIIRVSYKKKLFDTVDERTVHKGSVPRLGGSAFILSSMVGVCVGVWLCCRECPDCWQIPGSDVWRYGALVVAALIIYFVGVLDDVTGVNYRVKFLCQLISSVLIVLVGGFWINDFYGLFGLEMLSPWSGKTLSILLIMYIINAFNLIDGIDGLASSLGIVATLVMGVLLMIMGQGLTAVLALSLCASLVVFFCFNKFGSTARHTKIFMGDGGSQTMGLIIAFLVVFMAMKKDWIAPSHEPLQSPVVPFCLIVIPCFDAVRVMVGRIKRGKNPFLPDKTHIHHKFLRIGFTPARTLVAILLLDFLFIVLDISLTVAEIDIDSRLKINLILLLDMLIWWAVQHWLNKSLAAKEGDTVSKEQAAALNMQTATSNKQAVGFNEQAAASKDHAAKSKGV